MTERNQTNDSASLRAQLKDLGLAEQLISAAWPGWWDEAAEESVSARAELRFSLARKLGLDPRSLVEGNPRFSWREAGRFKHLTTEDESHRDVLTAFGSALGALLTQATPSAPHPTEIAPEILRSAVLRRQPFVRLVDLLGICWSLGVPTIHLRLFPLASKRMAAMAVGTGPRNAVLLGKDSDYPAHIAFYLAHEMGHIALGHVKDPRVLVDFEYLPGGSNDAEEAAADAFALSLLTGQADPRVVALKGHSAKELARVALEVAPSLGIEPGTLALCFGYATQEWATSNAAMPYIYENRKPVWREINELAQTQLDLSRVGDDSSDYLRAVLGGIEWTK